MDNKNDDDIFEDEENALFLKRIQTRVSGSSTAAPKKLNKYGQPWHPDDYWLEKQLEDWEENIEDPDLLLAIKDLEKLKD